MPLVGLDRDSTRASSVAYSCRKAAAICSVVEKSSSVGGRHRSPPSRPKLRPRWRIDMT